jgi:glycosyltransferase involved in cell wall biosynthesis
VSPHSLRVLLVGMAQVSERPGGGNRYLEDLGRSLTNLGATTRTLVLGDQPPTDPAVTLVGGPDQPVWRRVLGFAREIARLAKETDVLNTHFALYGVAASLSRRGRALPLVVNFQGPWAQESAVAGAGGRLAQRFKKAIEAYHYRRADALITLSQDFADLLVTDYGVARHKISVIKPGVDLVTFAPGSAVEARRRLDLPEAGFMAVAVRRLTARMGLEELIRAWSLLPAPAHLIIAGEGSERERLERLIDDLEMADRIQLLGRVEDELLPRLYQAGDVSVVPSLALEGFGLVVLESLACGTPVIASDTGGMAEVLPLLSSNSLVAPGDVSALSARLRRVMERPQDEPTPMACRRFAEQFSWTLKGQQVQEVLQRTTDF